MEDLSLASGFASASESDWLKLVENALEGKAFDVLRTPLYEGLTTEPLYTQRSGKPPVFGGRGWRVVQPLSQEPDEEAEALLLDFDDAPEAAQALKSLRSRELCFFLAPGASTADAAFALGAITNAGAVAVRGSAALDPVSTFALSGELPADRRAVFADHVDAAFFIKETFPSVVPFMASGYAWDAAGGSAVQELGFTLAAAVSYWRALAQGGMPVSQSHRSIAFSLAASADIFLTIAKFRALRLLWARALAAAAEHQQPDMLVLAQMSRRVLTACDPHMNLLRGTAAALGAAIGGADAIYVLPFDSVHGASSSFSRRLARNTGLILKHESQLWAVADAAAGSGYVEFLTDELAKRAWGFFREVEAQGGIIKALELGFVEQALSKTAGLRESAIARRKDKLTGVSAYPNMAERVSWTSHPRKSRSNSQALISDSALPPPGKGERFAALLEMAKNGSSLPELRLAARTVTEIFGSPLARKRDAEAFENLRQSADEALAAIGSRPPIFLAVLGTAGDYRARLNWVKNFFACGGIEVIVPDRSFSSVEELAAAFRQSPAPAVCLCSSDHIYGSMPGAAVALKKAGALAVYLAGSLSALNALAPADRTAIDRILYEGCNALALLREAQRVLRVRELSMDAQLRAAEDGFSAEGLNGGQFLEPFS